jgi:cyanophycinase
MNRPNAASVLVSSAFTSIARIASIVMLLHIALLISVISVFAQGYQSSRTGSSADATTAHKAGVVLAGGGTDNDDAMRWMLRRADGGDVVVLRTDRIGGYNSYFFSDLGVNVNSVETLVITSVEGARNSYVAQQIRRAEVLFIAGGDQTTYVRLWKGTPVQDAINYLIKEKKVTLGGTSAGMAVLGGVYYAPTGTGVVSGEALNNPYHVNMNMIGKEDFIDYPVLKRVLTDTHFEQRDRNGRHFAMLARVQQDWNQAAFGIACNERSAVCVDENGVGAVFSAGGVGENFVYFTQSNCAMPNSRPERCEAGMPITWDRNRQAVKALRVSGDGAGTAKFNLNTWQLATTSTATAPLGSTPLAQWEDWSANNGSFFRRDGSAPCVQAVTSVAQNSEKNVEKNKAQSQSLSNDDDEILRVRPNPVNLAGHEMRAFVRLRRASTVELYVVNALGQRVATLAPAQTRLNEGTHEFAIPALVTGSYRCVADIRSETGSGSAPAQQVTWMFIVAH